MWLGVFDSGQLTRVSIVWSGMWGIVFLLYSYNVIYEYLYTYIYVLYICIYIYTCSCVSYTHTYIYNMFIMLYMYLDCEAVDWCTGWCRYVSGIVLFLC